MKRLLLLMLSITAFLNTVAQTPNGYVAKYSFDGNMPNSVDGVNLTGTVGHINGVQYTNDRHGNPDEALKVNGGRLYGYEFNTNTESITIALWLKTPESNQNIIQARSSNGANGFTISSVTPSGYLNFGVYSGGTQRNQATTLPTFHDNNWHHLALVIDSKLNPTDLVVTVDTSVYIDGVLNTTLSNNLDYSFNSTAVSPYLYSFNNTAQIIISPVTATSASYTGEIDDIYIYEAALTASEISVLYNETSRTLAKTIYVAKNATGNNDGTDWTNAFTNLDAALRSTIANDEIWIASGVYNSGSVDRALKYTVNSPDIKIYGGFAGTEATISERAFGQNETILSGDLYQNDNALTSFSQLMTDFSLNDNGYNLLYINSTANNTLVDGITFSNVRNYNPSVNAAGGAIIKEATVANLTVNNCTFKDNLSGGPNAAILADFDLNNQRNGLLNIKNSKFINNMSPFGTCIYAYSRENSSAYVLVSNSLFINNQSTDRISTAFPYEGITGSAMWLRNLSTLAGDQLTVDILSSTFANNIDNGTNIGNNGGEKGVVSISNSSASPATDVRVINSIFHNNSDGTGTTTPSLSRIFDNHDPSSVLITNSMDEDAFSQFTGIINNNSTGNPLFTDESNDDYTLSSGSPAIDTGDTAYALGATDLNNNQRTFGTRIDIGAYEFNSVPLSVKDNQLDLRNTFSLYPNPTHNQLNITSQNAFKKAMIYSLLGTKILTSTNENINIESFNNGTYIVIIEDVKGIKTTHKFIKN